ncbi:hypothetical protein F2P81_025877 [Scophthalmus maximus]|uniref:Uncharacterized protein n=1 Tax=Scophthalmus maximus TaxID=52904 RepID=A0A6A4RR69_SCOMX|nr:hypothetical protein F2P81_025877 [Scophthalmus maximus]
MVPTRGKGKVKISRLSKCHLPCQNPDTARPFEANAHVPHTSSPSLSSDSSDSAVVFGKMFPSSSSSFYTGATLRRLFDASSDRAMSDRVTDQRFHRSTL